ncbi:N-acyl-L-amino acid amidohydrolase [Koleobacter methoxysyntrophicus]|jgi:amidohydrolase|uniref:N-acyl-L-amino acid amidohydrolase n=1 Tax=Koleobacter methoxysyntrophicus TaxID=2751313 RepID=A0A8A0RK32_9FIRM|nr:amidohydrolase [Koleobacter methoxysyntrophicus]QSQ07899.1 N-acyl-L-amino acid amidohydrolase [Koleobacter methoxysyntrophicus]
MNKRIKELINKYSNLVVEYRRDIHKHPELSRMETRTAALVADVLEGLNIKTLLNVGGTGVVGILEGNSNNRVIALRADMDALPIQEKTGLPFSSVNEGVMHACGHDMHTAILLGCAHVLSELKEQINGTVKFVFQPAEEDNPTGGAPGMIKEGVLENPKVDAIVSLHVWPKLETGYAGIKAGPMTASSDRIFITIKGKSSHGSAPEEGIDAVVIAANVISALQTIVSRNIGPLESSVISIGKLNGGYRYNIIADRIDMEGTVRNLDPKIRNSMPERIEKLVKGITEAMGGGYEFKYVKGYPPTVNEKNLTKIVYSAMRKVLNEKAVIPERASLGGEDFAFFSEKLPSAYIWLGCRPSGLSVEETPPLHNNRFNPDEKALTIGMEILISTVFEYLSG